MCGEIKKKCKISGFFYKLKKNVIFLFTYLFSNGL